MKKLFQKIMILFTWQLSLAQVSSIFSTKNSDFTIASKDVYKVIKSSENCFDLGTPGTPQLPNFSRNYFLPAGSLVTNLSYTNSSKIEMGGG